jgi:hypothetical protein
MPVQCEEFADQFISEIVIRECAGASVRVDFTVWQDEAALIPKGEIKQYYLDAGAIDVDVRLHPAARQSVRCETVLKAETLRDKLIAEAEIKGETVPEPILGMADQLEFMPEEELLAMVSGENIAAEKKEAA